MAELGGEGAGAAGPWAGFAAMWRVKGDTGARLSAQLSPLQVCAAL